MNFLLYVFENLLVHRVHFYSQLATYLYYLNGQQNSMTFPKLGIILLTPSNHQPHDITKVKLKKSLIIFQRF